MPSSGAQQQVASLQTTTMGVQQIGIGPSPDQYSLVPQKFQDRLKMPTFDFTEDTLLVGNLDLKINDYQLFETFASKIPGTISAKVQLDQITKLSKGFGYVKFTTPKECFRALTQLQNYPCGDKTMRLSPATSRKVYGVEQQLLALPIHSQNELQEDYGDPKGLTILVQGLDFNFSNEQTISNQFVQFGDIEKVKTFPIYGCAFVTFKSQSSADYAVTALQQVESNNSKISWFKVGATFNIMNHLAQTQKGTFAQQHVQQTLMKSTQKKNQAEVKTLETQSSKIDVNEQNLNYVALHCDQFLELTSSDMLLL